MTTTQNANDTYARTHAEALTLPDEIKDLLFLMPAPDVEEAPITWGDVGDINYVVSRLLELREQLEQFI